MHPHTYREIARAEQDANTIANLRVLVRQLERRVRSQQHRIAELEMVAGYEKVALSAETDRLRQALRR